MFIQWFECFRVSYVPHRAPFCVLSSPGEHASATGHLFLWKARNISHQINWACTDYCHQAKWADLPQLQKSHGTGSTSRPMSPELIFHAPNNFRIPCLLFTTHYILSRQTSDITFASAASPDCRLQKDVTSMRLTDWYRWEPNRISSTCDKKKKK